ncbi:indoleamine 2,3-dioxygenase 2-like [Acropora palmata]|uniref:indoleamine 2,3-dioxygenase 2-like n=1 Tax=Acropora palmata TaxID=6131 RepID=UPI003DA16717
MASVPSLVEFDVSPVVGFVPENVPLVLPKCLAVPWVAVANYLGIPPVITHCSYALYNWKYIDPSK